MGQSLAFKKIKVLGKVQKHVKLIVIEMKIR